MTALDPASTEPTPRPVPVAVVHLWDSDDPIALADARAAFAALGDLVLVRDASDDAGETDPAWVWPVTIGDRPGPAAAALLAALANTSADLVVSPASPAFPWCDPWSALVGSSGHGLTVLWRRSAHAALDEALTPVPRLEAIRLLEAGARATMLPPGLVARPTSAFATPDEARAALQEALAHTALITLDTRRRAPHAVLYTAAEIAGRAIACGAYREDLFAGFSALPPDRIDDSVLAGLVLCGLGAIEADDRVRADIDHLFDEIIAIGGAARPVDAARWRVLRRVFAEPPAPPALSVTPIDIDVSQPLAPIRSAGPRTLLARVHHQGEELDWIQVPSLDGAAAADLRIVLRDTLARQPAGRLIGKRKSAGFYGSLALAAARAAIDVARVAGAGPQSQDALTRLRARIVNDAEIANLAAFRAKRVRQRSVWPKRSPPVGAATRTPILHFPNIEANESGIDGAFELAAFEEHLRALAAAGYRSLEAGDWVHAIRAGRAVPSRCIVLTFDAPYTEFAEIAWPALQRNDFTGTIFVPVKLMGQKAAWRGAPKGKTVMDAITLRALCDAGCEIGAVGLLHRHLPNLEPDDMLEEAFDSRRMLERELNFPVEVVAYPYGECDAAVRSAFRLGGFVGGFGMRTGISDLTDDPMDLARIVVTPDMTPDALIARLDAKSGD